LVKHFARRTPAIELGNMDSVRDYVNVEYCVSVIERLLDAETPPQVLNICSGVPHSGQDVFRILSELTGHSPKILTTETFVRPNEVWRMVGCDKRLQAFMAGSGAAVKSLEAVLRELLAAKETRQ
jgi:nucleoside-diphosphate-sugar epimerase